MPKQISIPGCTWGVGEGQMQDPATGETTPTRVVVLQDPQGTEVFMFPMPIDEAKRFGQVLMADDPHAAADQMNQQREADLTIASQMPSEEEIQKVQAINQGLK